MFRLILACLILSLTASVVAQEKKLLPSDIVASSSQKTVDEIRYDYSKKVKTYTDKFTNQIWHEAHIGHVGGSILGRRHLSLTVIAPMRAKDYGSDWFDLYFTLSDGNYRVFSTRPHRLYVIADGQRLDLGDAELGQIGIGRRRIVESLRVRVPAEQFKLIATAPQVQMRFAGLEFELSQKQQLLLEAICRQARLIW